MQVSLGIANVLLHLPLAVAVAHNLGGAALLLVLVLVNYRLRAPLLAKQDAGLRLIGRGGDEVRLYSRS
ncbi:hypothetical protein D3C78_1697610 [compost metagenome]